MVPWKLARLTTAARLDDGTAVTEHLLREVIADEARGLRGLAAEGRLLGAARLDEALALFQDLCLAPEFPDFLTLPAYGRL